MARHLSQRCSLSTEDPGMNGSSVDRAVGLAQKGQNQAFLIGTSLATPMGTLAWGGQVKYRFTCVFYLPDDILRTM